MEILGPIQLYDKERDSEKTAPQILTHLTYDSRLTQYFRRLTYDRIRQLRKDPTVQLARWAVLAPMIHTPWVYESTNKGKTKATPEMVEFIEDTFIPLRDWFLAQAVFGTLDFGWQPFEVVYKPQDGQIWVHELKALLHDFTDVLVYLDSGGFAGYANEPYGLHGSTIVDEKYALNINFSIEGTDWYGYSVFESLCSIIDSWDAVEGTATRYDRKIAGATWIVYYPVGETLYKDVRTSNHVIANNILSTLEASGGVAVPDEVQDRIDDLIEDSIDKKIKGKWRIEIMSADASTQQSFIDRQKYLDALKMRAFGLPERSILEGKHGTKEDAESHGDIALSIVDSKHRLLCNTLNKYLIKKIMRLNYGKKYEDAVCIKPAPLVDSQFSTIKELYRLILQTPSGLEMEAINIDTKAMRDELGVPSLTNEKTPLVLPEPEPQPNKKVESNGKQTTE